MEPAIPIYIPCKELPTYFPLGAYLTPEDRNVFVGERSTETCVVGQLWYFRTVSMIPTTYVGNEQLLPQSPDFMSLGPLRWERWPVGKRMMHESE